MKLLLCSFPDPDAGIDRGFLPYRQKWPLAVVKDVLEVATIKRTINWLPSTILIRQQIRKVRPPQIKNYSSLFPTSQRHRRKNFKDYTQSCHVVNVPVTGSKI